MEWLTVVVGGVAIAGPLAIWLTVGIQLGTMKGEMVAMRELWQIQLNGVEEKITNQVVAERGHHTDHETRLRELEHSRVVSAKE